MPDREPSYETPVPQLHNIPPQQTSTATINDEVLSSEDYDEVKRHLLANPALIEELIGLLKTNKRHKVFDTPHVLSVLINHDALRVSRLL